MAIYSGRAGWASLGEREDARRRGEKFTKVKDQRSGVGTTEREGGEIGERVVRRVLGSYQSSTHPLFRPSPEDQRAARGLDRLVL